MVCRPGYIQGLLPLWIRDFDGCSIKPAAAAVYGIDAKVVDVEVDISGIKTNEERFTTVGLPDAAVRESCDAAQ